MRMFRAAGMTAAALVENGIAVVRRVRVVRLPALVCGIMVMNAAAITTETINVRGKVTDSDGKPIEKAIVTVLNLGLMDTTGADGSYAINNTPARSPIKSFSQSREILLENGSLKLSLPEPSAVTVEFFTIEGKLLKREALPNASSGVYRFSIDKKFHDDLLIIKISIDRNEFAFRSIRWNGRYLAEQSNGNSTANVWKLAKKADAVDTLKISAAQYLTKKIPIASYDQQVDVALDTSFINGDIISFDGFEGNNLDSAGYMKIYNPAAYGWMSVTTKAAHTGAYSLTSDSNNTGLRKWLDSPISDSIAGLAFYLKASQSGKTDFFAAIVTMGTSAGMLDNGFSTVLGMGIDKSDSLWYTFQKYDDPQADSDLIRKNFAPLEFNRWYKCAVEYDFTAKTLTYFLDGAVVFTRSAPGIRKLDMFITYRDGLGAQGPKDYFIDDITIYKR